MLNITPSAINKGFSIELASMISRTKKALEKEQSIEVNYLLTDKLNSLEAIQKARSKQSPRQRS